MLLNIHLATHIYLQPENGGFREGGGLSFFIEQSTSYQFISIWSLNLIDYVKNLIVLFQNPKKVFKTCEKYNLYIVNVDMNLENHFL